MSGGMSRRLWWAILMMVCWGCGPRRAEVIRRLDPPKASEEGPPASDEEASGEVPPLRPILAPKPLIPARKAPSRLAPSTPGSR